MRVRAPDSTIGSCEPPRRENALGCQRVSLRHRLLDVVLRPFGRVIDVSNEDSRRYGYGEVPAAQRQDLFNEHTRLDEHGFTEVRRGYFVREGAPEIHHVLSHFAGKHSTYIRWGLSLAFVPHEFGERLRFHRTLKSAQLDLFDQDWDERGASYLHTVTPWRREMVAMWQRAWPQAEQFWARGASVEGVSELAAELSAEPPGEYGFTLDGFFVTGPRFVHAMTLARLGREAEARATLAEWAAGWGTDLGTKFSVSGAERALEHVLALG